MVFLVARTASGRAALQHHTEDYTHTSCGIYLRGWSMAFMASPIKEILCKRCAKAANR